MGISVGHLLVVLLIVVLLFGTRRLATIGKDLGTALRGFREAVREPGKEEQTGAAPGAEHHVSERLAEGKPEKK